MNINPPTRKNWEIAQGVVVHALHVGVQPPRSWAKITASTMQGVGKIISSNRTGPQPTVFSQPSDCPPWAL